MALDKVACVFVLMQYLGPEGDLSDDLLSASHACVFENEVGIFLLLAQQTLLKLAFALVIDRRFHAWQS